MNEFIKIFAPILSLILAVAISYLNRLLDDYIASKKKQQITLDDVRKLIEDSIEKNNAKLLSQLRA